MFESEDDTGEELLISESGNDSNSEDDFLDGDFHSETHFTLLRELVEVKTQCLLLLGLHSPVYLV